MKTVIVCQCVCVCVGRGGGGGGGKEEKEKKREREAIKPGRFCLQHNFPRPRSQNATLSLTIQSGKFCTHVWKITLMRRRACSDHGRVSKPFLCFINCGGQSHKTGFTNHNF